jgi:hypothetical protein
MKSFSTFATVVALSLVATMANAQTMPVITPIPVIAPPPVITVTVIPPSPAEWAAQFRARDAMIAALIDGVNVQFGVLRQQCSVLRHHQVEAVMSVVDHLANVPSNHLGGQASSAELMAESVAATRGAAKVARAMGACHVAFGKNPATSTGLQLGPGFLSEPTPPEKAPPIPSDQQ